MTAKEYLENLKRLDVYINRKIEMQNNLKRMSATIGSFDYTKDRVQTSPKSEAPYASTINKIIDLDKEISKDIDEFIDKKKKIIDQIHGLADPDEITVLFERYVEYLTFDRIAENMGCSVRNVYFIQKRALNDFEKKYLS